MKKLFVFSCLMISSLATVAQLGVAISQTATTPDQSAILDVQSTSKGMLIPRMSSSLRTNISNPANGLLVFDTTTDSFWFFSGVWTELIDHSNAGWVQKLDTVSATKPLVGIGTANPSRMLTLQFSNANINTSHMLIEQAGTGDAWFNIGLSGAKNYAFGLDNSDNDKFKIGYNATGPSGLHVNTRLTIDTLGNFGIGTSSPAARLQVNSLVGQNPLRVDVAGTTKLQVSSNGGASVGSSTAPPANGLHVTGAINPAGGISSSGNITVNSTTGYISFTAGGSEIRLYANGHIDITAGGDLNISAGGDLSLSGNNVILESSGSMSIESSAAMGIDANGAMDITSGNTMDVINSGGTMSVRNLGGTLNVNSSSTLNLDGAIVDLNNGTNGAARLFDPVSGGIIVSGSTTVKIGN